MANENITNNTDKDGLLTNNINHDNKDVNSKKRSSTDSHNFNGMNHLQSRENHESSTKYEKDSNETKVNVNFSSINKIAASASDGHGGDEFDIDPILFSMNPKTGLGLYQACQMILLMMALPAIAFSIVSVVFIGLYRNFL